MLNHHDAATIAADYDLSERLGAELMARTPSDRDRVVAAMEAAVDAQLGYEEGTVSLRDMQRAMDHLAVERDRLRLSFFRLVRVG